MSDSALLLDGKMVLDGSKAEQHFDIEGLPTEHHFAALASATEASQLRWRRHAMLIALHHSSPSTLEQHAGSGQALFERLAGLSPAEDFQAHLCAVVDVMAQQLSPAVFLSDIFGAEAASTGASQAQVQEHRILQRIAVTRSHHCLINC
jgi:hypothetical protein